MRESSICVQLISEVRQAWHPDALAHSRDLPDVVWSEPKQTKLLDSIYRNYYVPPIVFDVYKDDDGEEIMRCVDGKQRLTSIQKFFDGQVRSLSPWSHKTLCDACACSLRCH